ncbi:MAG: hypothetical protein ACI9O3_001650, partial [Colwellia sp.]
TLIMGTSCYDSSLNTNLIKFVVTERLSVF